MKLRIQGNSLRLRLSRSEVARLLDGASLEETIHFASESGAHLTYALQRHPAISGLTVSYTENKVAVLLPADQANSWATTEQVGIAADLSVGEFGTLAVLIEKDFACLDRSDADNQDTFANPHADAACQVASD